MASDDPFFSPSADDRTVIRPIPGGRRTDLRQPPGITEPPQTPAGPLPRLGALNPLEQAASGLLALLTRINSSHTQTDPAELKNKIIHEIKQFQINAQAKNIDHSTISSTRYVLCTVLDEAVLNTPWGNNSGWAKQSLLSLFHKEVSGGERFFHLLKSLAQNPSKNRDLLELMYLCLSLGFEGRYRILDGGKDKLERIREWLYQILQQQRGPVEQALSPHWQGVTDRRNPLLRMMPLWVVGAIAAGLLAAMFSGFLFRLNQESDPVFRNIFAITPPQIEITELEPEPEPVAPPPTPPKVTLSMLLQDEIAQNKVKVVDLVQRSIVTIRGDNLFSSGKTAVNSKLIPLLHRLAEALNQLQGQVLIIGHSDNVPIRSARFPSNWHLSKARAESVAAVIKQNLTDPNRIIVEGKADLEPIAPNTTRAGRAKNRRVEIVLLSNND
jgi:type VI secretion system protein ImpK